MAFALSLSPIASAQVQTLDFSDGMGSSLVDQYTGIGGNGWGGDWKLVSGNPDVVHSNTVINTDPLYSGGGNYLHSSMTYTKGTIRQIAVSRAVDLTAIQAGQAYSYSFYFRPESAPGASGDNAQYLIFGNPTAAGGPSAGTTWSIQSSVSDTSVWELGLGNGTSTFAATTMAVTKDTTYLFTITTDPTAKTYSVIISDGTNVYSSLDAGLVLQWRRMDSLGTTEYIHFGSKATLSGNENTVAFSVDHIGVNQIPEPATLALLTGLAALVSAVALRRRKRN